MDDLPSKLLRIKINFTQITFLLINLYSHSTHAGTTCSKIADTQTDNVASPVFIPEHSCDEVALKTMQYVFNAVHELNTDKAIRSLIFPSLTEKLPIFHSSNARDTQFICNQIFVTRDAMISVYRLTADSAIAYITNQLMNLLTQHITQNLHLFTPRVQQAVQAIHNQFLQSCDAISSAEVFHAINTRIYVAFLLAQELSQMQSIWQPIALKLNTVQLMNASSIRTRSECLYADTTYIIGACDFNRKWGLSRLAKILNSTIKPTELNLSKIPSPTRVVLLTKYLNCLMEIYDDIYVLANAIKIFQLILTHIRSCSAIINSQLIQESDDFNKNFEYAVLKGSMQYLMSYWVQLLLDTCPSINTTNELSHARIAEWLEQLEDSFDSSTEKDIQELVLIGCDAHAEIIELIPDFS